LTAFVHSETISHATIAFGGLSATNPTNCSVAPKQGVRGLNACSTHRAAYRPREKRSLRCETGASASQRKSMYKQRNDCK
jgi:hypothetical protein